MQVNNKVRKFHEIKRKIIPHDRCVPGTKLDQVVPTRRICVEQHDEDCGMVRILSSFFEVVNCRDQRYVMTTWYSDFWF